MKLTKFNSLPGATPIEKLEKWSNGAPIYVQQKYNGINARYLPAERQLITRDNKRWDMSRFPAEFLADLHRTAKNSILSGELMYYGTPLQKIAGLLSVNGKEPIPAEDLLFMIYDMQGDAFIPFSERLQDMRRQNLMSDIFCDTYIVTPNRAEDFYHRMVKAGYEGVVYRIDPCYDRGPADAPNPHAVKRKALHTAEGICIGHTEGKGKRAGMLGCLIVQLENGQRLSVGGGAGLSDDVLRELYKSPPYGKHITYSYEELSTTGIPLRPQFVAVRDYE